MKFTSLAACLLLIIVGIYSHLTVGAPTGCSNVRPEDRAHCYVSISSNQSVNSDQLSKVNELTILRLRFSGRTQKSTRYSSNCTSNRARYDCKWTVETVNKNRTISEYLQIWIASWKERIYSTKLNYFLIMAQTNKVFLKIRKKKCIVSIISLNWKCLILFSFHSRISIFPIHVSFDVW